MKATKKQHLLDLLWNFHNELCAMQIFFCCCCKNLPRRSLVHGKDLQSSTNFVQAKMGPSEGGLLLSFCHADRSQRPPLLLSEIHWTDHHGACFEGMSGPFPVVPLHAIVSDCGRIGRVIDAIQVRRSTGIKPPTWRRQRRGKREKRKNI